MRLTTYIALSPTAAQISCWMPYVAGSSLEKYARTDDAEYTITTPAATNPMTATSNG